MEPLHGLLPLSQRAKWGGFRWDSLFRVVSSTSAAPCSRIRSPQWGLVGTMSIGNGGCRCDGSLTSEMLGWAAKQ